MAYKKRLISSVCFCLALSAATTEDNSDIFGNYVNIRIKQLLVLSFMESSIPVIHYFTSFCHVVRKLCKPDL